jgi:hypothetical protein
MDRFPYPAAFYMTAYRSYQMSAAAVNSETSMSGRDFEAARVRLIEQRSRARWALASRGTESIPFAIRMLESSDSDEQDDGRVILGLVGRDDAAIDVMVEMLADSDDRHLRSCLVRVLTDQPNERALLRLTALVMDASTSTEMKNAAIKALGLLGRRPESPKVDKPDVNREVARMHLRRPQQNGSESGKGADHILRNHVGGI